MLPASSGMDASYTSTMMESERVTCSMPTSLSSEKRRATTGPTYGRTISAHSGDSSKKPSEPAATMRTGIDPRSSRQPSMPRHAAALAAAVTILMSAKELHTCIARTRSSGGESAARSGVTKPERSESSAARLWGWGEDGTLALRARALGVSLSHARAQRTSGPCASPRTWTR